MGWGCRGIRNCARQTSLFRFLAPSTRERSTAAPRDRFPTTLYPCRTAPWQSGRLDGQLVRLHRQTCQKSHTWKGQVSRRTTSACPARFPPAVAPSSETPPALSPCPLYFREPPTKQTWPWCHLQILRCARPRFGSQFRPGTPKIFGGYRILGRGFLPMTETRLPFCSVEEAAEEIRQGRMIVLVDDEDRENEGDLTMAAEKITPEAINFMAKYGRGLICLTLTEQRCEELNLPLMSPINTSQHRTAFCEAIDARVGVSTGISASDRAITILTAIDPKTRPQDLARPGHMFPLRARNGGVLVRAGQTEASVDLSRIAGLNPSGVICEIMNEDGTMARVPQLIEFCREHNLKMLTVADLIRYRMAHERYVRRMAEAILPTRYGDFRMIAYSCDVDHDQHVALIRGDLTGADPPLVRVHSHCLTGDVFGSNTCDCSELIARSLELIARENRGLFLYLHHTGRGFTIDTPETPGSLPKIHFHTRGQLDRDAARQRMVQHESGIGAQILIDLGLKDIRVVTNHPKKVVALEGYGIRIADQVPLNLTSPKPTHQHF